MPAMPRLSDLTAMLETAMEDRAPNKLARLRKTGMLTAYLKARAGEAQQTYLAITGTRPTSEAVEESRLNPMERVAAIESRRRQARDEAIAQMLEHVEDEPTPPRPES